MHSLCYGKGNTFFLSQKKIKGMWCENKNVAWETTQTHLVFHRLHSSTSLIPFPSHSWALSNFTGRKMSSFYFYQGPGSWVSISGVLRLTPNFLKCLLPFSNLCHHQVIFINHCNHQVLSLMKPLQNFPTAFCSAFFICSTY